MASETLRFDLLANDRASRVFDKFGRTVDDTESKMSKVGRGLLAVGKVAATGLAVGVGAGALAMKKFVGDAEESRRVTKLTEAVIKSTGGAAKISAVQVAALSTAISNKTGVDDEAIQTGSNLLLTFKNVRNEVGKGADIFNRATAAAVDLSAAGFGSIDSGSKMLGKALNDPIAGITALSRAGVTFTEAQKEQIKAMVESGNILGAQKKIMAEVQSQVGGAAAATGTATDKLRVILGNLSEQIGAKLLPYVDRAAAGLGTFIGQMQSGEGVGGRFAGALRQVAGWAQQAFDVFQTSVLPRLREFAGLVATEVLPRVVRFAGFVRNDLAPALAQFATVVLPAARAALASVGRSLQDLLGTFSDGKGDVRSFGSAVTTAITVAGPLVAAGLKVMALNVRVLVESFQAATAPLRFFARLVANTVEGVRTAFADADGIGMQFGRNLALGMVRGIAGMAGSVMSAAGDLASRAVAAIRDRLKIFSPSRVTIEIGEFFSEGLGIGIKQGAKVAIEATSDLIEKVKSRLSDLRSQAASIRSGARDAVLGSFDFGGIGATSTDAEGNTTTASPVAQFADFAAKSTAFAGAVSQGVANGLDPRILASAVGTGNLAVVQSLAALDPAGTGSVNRDFALAQKMAAQVGQTVLTTTTVPEQIAREEERLRVMREIRDDLRNRPQEIRFVINDATDPDKVVAAIRKYIRRNGLLRDVAAP